MPGPAPKKTRRRRNAPARGEWQPSPGIGWQHGPIPPPPDGLIEASREAWRQWFTGWWASNWNPNHLAGLEIAILAHDAVRRANPPKANDITALVRLMDTYGITPAGQQARHWAPPDAQPAPAAKAKPSEAQIPAAAPYRHLAVVAGGKG